MKIKLEKIYPAITLSLIALVSFVNAADKENSKPDSDKLVGYSTKLKGSKQIKLSEEEAAPAAVVVAEDLEAAAPEEVATSPVVGADVPEAATSSAVEAEITAQPYEKNTTCSASDQNTHLYDGINRPARPHVNNSVFSIMGDFLWWQASENGLSYAIKNNSQYRRSTGLIPNDLSNAKVQNLHSHWDPGFRIGLIVDTSYDGWDVALNWLRFDTRRKKTAAAKNSEWLVSTLMHPADVAYPMLTPKPGAFNNPYPASFGIPKAHAHWKLFLDQVDLEVGREFFVSKRLTLRPNFGLRGAWIDQKFNVLYEGSALGTSPNSDAETDYNTLLTKVRLESRFWGVGVAGGLDSKWELGSGFSLYGDLSLAILYGYFHTKREDKLNSFNIVTGLFQSYEFVHLKNNYHDPRAIFDIELGFSWERMFEQNECRVVLNLGWESHIYFDQNQFMYFMDTNAIGNYASNQGNLNLQGLTAGIEFDF